MLKPIVLLMLTLLCGCTTSHMFNEAPAPSRNLDTQALTTEPQFWQNSPTITWNKIQHYSAAKLENALSQAKDPATAGWLKLAIISKKHSISSQELAQQLMNWRKEYPTHAANALFPDDAALTTLQNTPAPKNIALLLPLDGSLGASGNLVRNGFLNAYYEGGKKSQQNVFFVNTSKTLNMTALYQQAIAQGADTIVGPLTKEQVSALLKQGSFAAPTIALNYTILALVVAG